ncbi:MAG: hypothetical protein ACRYF3_08040 [Janthinobacterium lividum]
MVLVSLDDLGEVAKRLRTFLENPVQTYPAVALILIVINLLLERLAKFVQRKLSGGGKGAEHADGRHR